MAFKDLKICKKCGIGKPFNEFRTRKDTKNGYRNECKKCEQINSQDYKKNNPNYFVEYYKNNIECFKNKSKKHYENNISEIKKRHNIYSITYRELNKSYFTEYNKKYQKTDKYRLIVKNSQHKRRTHCKNTDITYGWLKEFEEKSVMCAICNCKMNKIKKHPQSKHLDHIVPINIGGKHLKTNVRYLCQTCNLKRPKNGSDLNVSFVYQLNGNKNV